MSAIDGVKDGQIHFGFEPNQNYVRNEKHNQNQARAKLVYKK